MLNYLKDQSITNWILLGIAAILCTYFMIRIPSEGIYDLQVYLDAASKILSHQELYDCADIRNQSCKPYYYSPLFALLLSPFTFLPSWITILLWLITAFYMLYRIAQIIISYLKPTPKQQFWIILIPTLICINFLLENFILTQLTIFMLWASLQSLDWIYKGKNIKGSTLLALAINFKLLPLIFIGLLFYHGYFRALLYIFGFTLIGLILPALFLGWDYNTNLHIAWFSRINPMADKFNLEDWNGPHSFSALIPVYLMKTEGKIEVQRHFMELPLEQVKLIINLVRLFFLGLSLYFFRTFPFHKPLSPIHYYWEISFLSVLTPLLFPIQLRYAFLYLAPAIAYLVYQLFQQKKRSKQFFHLLIFIICAVLIGYPGKDVLGTYLFNWTQHFRILSWGAILLIIALMLSPPTKNSSNKAKN